MTSARLINPTERRLAAVMIADVAGFSRLMERDESATFHRLRQLRDTVIYIQVEAHAGRVIKTTGDGFLAEFPSASAAVRCGIEIQRAVIFHEATQPMQDRIRYRIGIHLGDVIVDGVDIAGDGVNIAARLEALSPPDGLCVSAHVREQIHDELSVAFEEIGEQRLKNIARPVRAFVVRLAPGSATESTLDVNSPVPGFGGKPAIAVLPFDNMSSDPEQAYLADGIAEDILTRLAMWRWIPVIGRNSSFSYRGKSVNLRQVGAELGARYVLEGSVRKSADRVRITGQLIDADTGHHVWAHRYDRVMDDMFALQDEITDAIVTALEPAVGRAERAKANQKGTRDLAAWDIYQRGAWHYSQLTRESMRESYRLCIQAADQDRQFSSPAAGAAACKFMEAQFGWSDAAQALPEAYQLAIDARNRDPMDPFALAILGFTCCALGMHDAAQESSERSITLNPSFAPGHFSLGYVAMLVGRQHDAIQSLRIALRLSPNDAMMGTSAQAALSGAYYLAGEYEAAREIAARCVQDAPHYPMGYRSLASALGQLGRIDEGRKALDRFLEMVPAYSLNIARQTVRFRDAADFARYMAGLEALGWKG